jgi:twitching motility protein PilJ
MVFKLPSFKKSPPIRKITRGETGESAPLPLIGKLPTHTQLQIVGVAAALALLVAVVAAVLDYRTTSVGTRYIELSGRLLFLTQRVTKDAGQAVLGNPTAIESLPGDKKEIEDILLALDQGGEGMPPTSGTPRVILNKLLPAAQQSTQYVQEIIEGRPGILTVTAAVSAVDELNPILREMMPQLTAVDGARGTRFALLMERIGKDVTTMLGSDVKVEQIAALGSDTEEAEAVLAGFNQTNPTVLKVAELFDTYRISVEAIIGQVPQLLAAKQSLGKLFDSTSLAKHGDFVTGTTELNNAYTAALSHRWTTYLMVAAALTLLLALALLSKVYLDDARHRAAEAERASRKSQQAILLLMNEMSDLADGDLTTKATVTDDITGAIADAVNYTTDELRRLVAGVSSASDRVSEATAEAQATAQELLSATQEQAKDIRETGEAVELITKSIQEVDNSATQSARVARRTLEVTEQGAQAVRNAITGMDAIREQIQETAKRIKRLGESSQEIGEIVDLIADITEQTNVLALNAAIQAAAAGEAGRGFSVVAEEVQRLAERSAEATKQISALVKTIQGDTQDAVAAMEQSTQGVVDGAKLSDIAGQSLREIEQVSHELADLISSISVSTQVQTDMAREVATTMTDILRLTEQTTAGTQKTATSVAELTDLATDLKGSVSGFKL